jgi:hypothetical protein
MYGGRLGRVDTTVGTGCGDILGSVVCGCRAKDFGPHPLPPRVSPAPQPLVLLPETKGRLLTAEAA